MIKTRIQLAPKEYRNLWYGGKKIYRVCSIGIVLILGKWVQGVFQGDVSPFGEEGGVCCYCVDRLRRNIEGYCKTESREWVIMK
jgi:hypothetical protein